MDKNTFPNQRMITIHKEPLMDWFIGINRDVWFAACRDLGGYTSALKLYTYLAANKNGYNLAFSPAAILKEIGMPTSTTSDQFKILVDKGYLVLNHNNTYDFYEYPRLNSEQESDSKSVGDAKNKADSEITDSNFEKACPNFEKGNPPLDREINIEENITPLHREWIDNLKLPGFKF